MCNNGAITVTASFLSAVKSLISSDAGVNLSPIVSDLCGNVENEVERNKVFCTMGLLLRGAKFELAPVTYYTVNKTHIRVRMLESASFLKDDVTYTDYDFRYSPDENANNVWSLYSHYTQHTDTVSWEQYSTELKENDMPEGCTLAAFWDSVDRLIAESKKEGAK